MLLEIIASAVGHHMNGNAGSVGSDEGSGLAVLFDVLKDLLFDVEALYYYFYYPVGVGDAVEVVFGIAGFDELSDIFGVDG